MRQGTNPILLKTARFFQAIPPFFLTWIEFFFKKKRRDKFPIIFLVATPRSGSTLTYQILNRGTKSLYISNFWNLLYALPLFGGKKVNDSYNNNDFKSDIGLVSGISGESEGMKFWSYWIGQGLEQTRNTIAENRIKYIQSVFSTLVNNKKPLISGYLGHVFSIRFLRNFFPGSVFIYLKRDELSNIYSMVKTYREFDKNRIEFEWMSVKPKGWKERKDLDVIDKTFWQFKTIQKNIETSISEKDTLVVRYEEICCNPHQFLKDVKEFVKKHDIDLNLNLDNIPNSFNYNIIQKTDDDDAKKIKSMLDEK